MTSRHTRWWHATSHLAGGVTLVASIAALAAALHAQREPAWFTQDPGTTRPVARSDHAVVYDATRKKAFFHGGYGASNNVLVDSWEWTPFYPSNPVPPYRGYWTQRSNGPGRYGHAMVWDVVNKRAILFGGIAGTTVYNETWTWSGSSWAKLSLTSLPPARFQHGLAYDSVRSRVVLFGGSDRVNLLADTHEFDGSKWIPLFPSTFPTPRAGHAMVFDPVRQRVLLFGGQISGSTFGNDTWDYDGSNWRQLQPKHSPPPRMRAAIAFDDQRGVVVLFGGIGSVQDLNDTWEWDGVDWTQRQAKLPLPQCRSGVAMVFDPAVSHTILLGGDYGGVRLDDVWEYHFPAGVTTFGFGCPGSVGVPLLTGRNTTNCVVGRSLDLVINNRPAGATSMLIIGVSRTAWGAKPLPLDLSFLGMPGCMLYVSFDFYLPTEEGVFTTSLPNDPRLLGMQVFAQGVVVDPNAGNALGVVATNGATATIGN